MQLEFREVTLADKTWIDAYLKPYQLENSESSFTYYIIWGLGGRIKVAECQDVLYTRLQFGSYPPFMFAPVPKDPECDYMRAVSVAIEHFIWKEGMLPVFRCITEPFKQMFEEQCPGLPLEAERDIFDYIYSADDLITLRGKKFHSKRNHINQFSSVYQYEYRPLTTDMYDACMEICENWLKGKDPEQPGIMGELQAIRFMIPNMEPLGVQGGGIFINDKLCAFSLGERLREDIALIHVEKADAAFNGLYAVINQQFAQHAWHDVKWINREEDMGLEGMRKAKLSYNPVKLVEKYRARPKR